MRSPAGSAVVAAPAGAPQGWSALPPAGTLRAAYLHAGHIIVSRDPCRVTTVLGSCVAVGLWDPAAGVGGLNHFLLPERLANGAASPRFGNVAVRELIEGVIAAGGHRRALQAKLFGGACVLRAFRKGGWHLGSTNVDVARRMLREEGIPIAAEDVEGTRGRKLIFQTHDGAAWVRSL